ncbi:MAG: polysaccharide biosynthesis/export family protein [Bacteroidaceae bacterium]|nr:polysaccharide biosynthesis/export family protein [Bacteroidaceae bacterium]
MRGIFRVLVMLCAALTIQSCVSTKKIVYFQGADELMRQGQAILQQYEMRLKPADQVMVKVTCKEPELLTVFSQDVLMGTQGNTSNLTNSSGSLSNAYAYTITNAGNLVLPSIGKVQVAGMTVDEAANAIEKAITETNDIKNPEVTVRLLNARVAVLGAVQRPMVVSLTSERNTIADVLSQCGDIDDTGLRQKVKLFREVDGVRKMYELDMTKADVFQSPGYYVQQNDMIYVEPNKSKSIKSSAFYTFLSAGASIVGLIASITSLVLVLARK